LKTSHISRIGAWPAKHEKLKIINKIEKENNSCFAGQAPNDTIERKK